MPSLPKGVNPLPWLRPMEEASVTLPALPNPVKPLALLVTLSDRMPMGVGGPPPTPSPG